MSDFVETLGLRPTLNEWGINSNRNFEDIFSEIFDAGGTARISALEERIREYFSGLQIGPRPTIYDHLVLSLRKKDFIATFNWDPLLLQAYRRNAQFELPRLIFLHGNIAAGFCDRDRTAGNVGALCSKCHEQFTPSPLLFPIRKKNYAINSFIASEWRRFKAILAHTFMVSVFGYSGPKTDEEALFAMSAAWGPPKNRELEQTCFITTQIGDEVVRNFSAFIHTHHYEIDDNFYDSWIARHPRRTGEAWWNQYMLTMFLPDNPLPRNADFPELWAFFKPFAERERRFQAEAT